MAFDETSMRIEGPNRAVNEPILFAYEDRAWNGEIVWIIGGGARLHVVTVSPSRQEDHSALGGNCCTSGRCHDLCTRGLLAANMRAVPGNNKARLSRRRACQRRLIARDDFPDRSGTDVHLFCYRPPGKPLTPPSFNSLHDLGLRDLYRTPAP